MQKSQKREIFSKKIALFPFFGQNFFWRSLIFGSRGGDSFWDARGGAFPPRSPPPSPTCDSGGARGIVASQIDSSPEPRTRGPGFPIWGHGGWSESGWEASSKWWETFEEKNDGFVFLLSCDLRGGRRLSVRSVSVCWVLKTYVKINCWT